MLEPTISTEKKVPGISEINILEILKFIKKYSFIVILSGFICGVLGYALSFLFPVAYNSYAVLLPESGTASNSMGSLSGLARLSGLTKNESGGALQPELYPRILQTVPFSLYILKQQVVDENGHSYPSFKEFLHHSDSKNKEVQKVQKSASQKISKEILLLSKEDEKNSKLVLSLITTSFDVKTDIITINSETSDPVISAQLVKAATDYLIKYVSDYRTEKTLRDVQFLGQRVFEAKKREQNSEYLLQNYRDRNRNAFLNVARIEEQRLQAEYVLAQSLYSDIVHRWEEAKIKIKEQQPVIKVLEPAIVPLIKSKPKRLIITLIFAFLGAVGALIFIMLKNFSNN